MYDASASKSVIHSRLRNLREEGSGKILFATVCFFMHCVQKNATRETCGRTSPFILRPVHADCLKYVSFICAN